MGSLSHFRKFEVLSYASEKHSAYLPVSAWVAASRSFPSKLIYTIGASLLLIHKGAVNYMDRERRGGFNRGPREMHDAVCADCGKTTQVPFVPDPNRPVYCQECYQKHRPPRKSY